MSYAEKGRRRLRVFAFVVAGLFIVIGLVSWWTGRENLREGSRLISEGGPALEIRQVPRSYRAVYRVENHAGNKLVITTERDWFRRPFQSRIESYQGPPPGNPRLTLRQSAFGVLTSLSPRSAPLNIAVPPSLASGDLRIDAVLKEAVADKTILRRERREVYGRECQVYRTGGPVFAGDMTRYDAGAGEYADVCVDGNGIVVEEYWVSDDRLLQRRVAVEVEIEPSIDPKLFEIEVPEQPGFQRGSVKRVERDPSPELWALEEPPAGFSLLGRFGVAISPNAVPQLNQLVPSAAPVSTSDVYTRGPDLLVVDQDPSLREVTRNEGRQVREVEIENLEDAVMIFDARMSEVRGEDADGSVVRVFGTVPPSELLEIAQQLKRGV